MIGEPMRTLPKILLVLAIGVGVPSFAPPAQAAGVATVQGRDRRRAHRRREHHRERQRERRHEERHEHPGEL